MGLNNVAKQVVGRHELKVRCAGGRTDWAESAVDLKSIRRIDTAAHLHTCTERSFFVIPMVQYHVNEASIGGLAPVQNLKTRHGLWVC